MMYQQASRRRLYRGYRRAPFRNKTTIKYNHSTSMPCGMPCDLTCMMYAYQYKLYSIVKNHFRALGLSVPARLGKGQGAKEIGHNLAREQHKIGHNLVRKRHKIGHSLELERLSEGPKFGHNPAHEQNEIWAQFCRRSMKTWAQICKHKHFYTGCLKTQQQLHFVNGKQ